MEGSWRYTAFALKLFEIYFPQSLSKTFVIPVTHIGCMVCYLVVIATQFPQLKTISEWVQTVHAFVAFLQMLLKSAVLWKQKQQYTNLLTENQKFWSTTLSPERSKNQLDAILEYTLVFQRYYIISVIVGEAVFNVAAFVQGNIPLSVWKTTQYQDFYYPALGVGVCALFFCVGIAAAVDSVFLVFCAHLGVQFRILADHFAQLQYSSEAEYESDLKKYLQYHDFLLRFQEDMQRFYSPILTIQYLTTAPLICVNMYMLLEGENFNIMLTSFFAVVAELFQISLYCIPAEMLINMAAEVGSGVYDSDWASSTSAKIRNSSVLVIQRSQQPMAFLGAGMFDFRARTLLTVMRASYSVCTVMRAMKNK